MMEALLLATRFLEEGGDEHYGEKANVGSHHHDKPWGDVLLAALLVQLITLSGVALAGFSVMMRKDHSAFMVRLHSQLVPSFAAGALMATAVFFVIPESINLLQEGGAASHTSHADEAIAVEDVLHEEENLFHNETAMDDHDHDHDHDHIRRFLQQEEEAGGHVGHDESYIWKFGAALMAGFLFPILLHAFFPSPDITTWEECEAPPESDEEPVKLPDHTEPENTNEPALVRTSSHNETLDLNCEEGNCCHKKHQVMENIDNPQTIETEIKVKDTSLQVVAVEQEMASCNWPLALSILLGDGFHNFTDGVFIGNAFLMCSRTLGYTMIVTTIYHELAQEIADYALLVHHCGLKPVQALALNFCAGFSVWLGALVIMILDLNEIATATVMAISAGVYLYIATAECIPRIQASVKTSTDTLRFFMCFVMGAVPIGLVLLNHGHCEAGEAASEATHDH